MKNLKQKLKGKSKDWLVDQLFQLCVADNTNTERILLSLSAEDDGGIDLARKFTKRLDKAVEEIVDHGPGSWDSQLPSAGFDIVLDALTDMLPKNLTDVMEIAEYALVKLDSIFELQDECELEYLVDEFRELHLQACRDLKPDPSILGARLAELAKVTEWGFFDGPPTGYAEVLGKEGLAAYKSKIS